MNKEQKKKILYISVSTIIIWMITHGYRFMNNLYTCDSLLEVFQDDIAFQRSLGRFMQPAVMVLRGVICSPWLIGAISMFFVGLSIYFISEILKIENPVYLIILSGIIICNNTMTSSIAGFIPWVDVYAASLFFAVLGVWFIQKDKILYNLLACVSFIFCMGLYQAYIDVAIAVLVILFIVESATSKEFKKLITKISKAIGTLLLSGIAYFVVHKLVCKIHHINETSSYHGLSEIANYNDSSVLSVLVTTYQNFFKYLFRQETFVSTILMGIRVSTAWQYLLNICLVCCIIAIIAGIIILDVKNKTKITNIILQIIGFILLPLAINFVCFLSKGTEHDLMLFAFSLVYVFALYIMSLFSDKSKSKAKMYLVTIPLILFIWNGIVFSNQLYFKLDMADRAAESIATRVIDDIEDTEGYVIGETPVCFYGTFDRSDYMQPVIYLKDVKNGDYPTPFTYDSSLPFYLKVYMDVNINVSNRHFSPEEVSDIPNYPKEGSIRFIDDTLFVKISD